MNNTQPKLLEENSEKSSHKASPASEVKRQNNVKSQS